MAVAFMSAASGAGETGLDVRLIPPSQSNSEVSEDVNALFMKRLEHTLRKDGINLRDDYGHFDIMAKLVNTNEIYEPGPPEKYVVATYLTLEVLDANTGKTFASKAFPIKASGSDVRRAYLNAMSQIDALSGEFKQFIHTAESQIMIGFNKNYKMYLEKARRAAEKKDYRQALSCTTIIPSSCKGANEAETATLTYYQKYLDQEGARLLAEAKKILKGKRDSAASEKALTMLSDIDSASASYSEAQRLIKIIRNSGTAGGDAAVDTRTPIEKAKEVGRKYLREKIDAGRSLELK